ncbi:MAG: cytochrome c oxidase subunit II [Armatimonadetes bacterium]|nr:cytochrome c oxidase subunit II [Armatimonadota bacterium]
MNFQLAPDRASNFAGQYDALFYTFSAFAVFFTIAVFVMVVTFVTKYRRGKKANRANPIHHNSLLEAIFMGVPTIIALTMFVFSAKLFVDMRTPPKNSYEVFVIGKQWMWHLQHPNGIRENNELHVPVGQPVKLTMISQDVIHGFFIPDYRVQYQVVPGRYTQLWFTPTKPGKFNLFCTIHCGTQHSEMGGYVYAMEPKDFAEWQATGGNRFKERPKNLADAGKQLYEELLCNNCHMEKDNPRAPSLYGIFQSKRKMTDGTVVEADENYIRESIVNPYNRLNAGYGNQMPIYEYKKQISEEQIRMLLEYIKTLGSAPAPVTTPAPTARGNAAGGQS